jgi:predicted enzyme related to lactoylglutathione lyase
MAGRVVHFEIPYQDGDRAQQFYKAAFDWQLQSMPGMGYVLVTTGPTGDRGPTEPGFINGGMFSRDVAPSSGPLVVVDVESIDDSLQRIGELGGRTVRGREPVGDMGFAAYAEDSEGNVVGLWETAARP